MTKTERRAHRYRLGNLKKRNGNEEKIQFMLTQLEELFIREKTFTLKEQLRIADFYLPRLNLCVEVDGPYHETERQRKIDLNKDSFYKKLGLRVLRITYRDMPKDFKDLRQRLTA